MTSPNWYLVLLYCFFSGIPLVAQVEDRVDSPSFRIAASGAYLLGGQIYDESFSYNPAFSGELALYYTLSPSVHVGAGTAYVGTIQGERFLPFFLSFIGFTKPETSGTYFLLNAGHSFAWGRDFSVNAQYDLKGSWNFKAGFGKRFNLGDKSLLFGLALQHQWARGVFNRDFGGQFEEPLNFDWLAVELRFFY